MTERAVQQELTEQVASMPVLEGELPYVENGEPLDNVARGLFAVADAICKAELLRRETMQQHTERVMDRILGAAEKFLSKEGISLDEIINDVKNKKAPS